MDILITKTQPEKQKKYRRAQKNKGLTRYELQISAESKARFEKLVEAAADEFQKPWDKRRRMAQARAQIFDEITDGICHDFCELQNQIKALKEEITALSPNFFKSNITDRTPLPQAIASLPDDPQHLKELLANTFKDGQAAKRAALEHKRKAEQFQKLYETVDYYNESLKEKLAQYEDGN